MKTEILKRRKSNVQFSPVFSSEEQLSSTVWNAVFTGIMIVCIIK